MKGVRTTSIENFSKPNLWIESADIPEPPLAGDTEANKEVDDFTDVEQLQEEHHRRASLPTRGSSVFSFDEQ